MSVAQAMRSRGTPLLEFDEERDMLTAQQSPTTSAWLDSSHAVVETPEEIDIATAPTLRCALIDLHEERRNLVILDMTKTVFMDSTGLGVLVGAIKRARAAGGAVVLAAAPERILRVMRVTGLTKILPCFEKVGEAFLYLDTLHD